MVKADLSERKKVVSVSNAFSEPRRVEYGVIHGTGQGPMLFNLYLNDFFEFKTLEDKSVLLMIHTVL